MRCGDWHPRDCLRAAADKRLIFASNFAPLQARGAVLPRKLAPGFCPFLAAGAP